MNEAMISATITTEAGKLMLWFDDRKGVSTAEKVVAAAGRYCDNYSEPANVCICHEGDLGGLSEVSVGGAVVRLISAPHVRPNNFLVGRE